MNTSRSPGEPLRDPHELETDIAETRERLSDNIDELAEKLNPKTQARQAADDARARAEQAVRETQVRALATLRDTRVRAQKMLQDTTGRVSGYARSGLALLRTHPREAAGATGTAVAALGGLIIRRVRAGR